MKNVIYIVSVLHDDRSKQQKYQYCHESWRYWAKLNNAEVFILNKEIFKYEYMKPNWYKYYAFKLLDINDIEYDNICVVDSDTIINPKTPNFFNLSIDSILTVKNFGSLDWIFRSIEIYGELLFPNVKLSHWEYFNSGFMVFPKSMKSFVNSIVDDYYPQNCEEVRRIEKTFGIGNDQTIFNYLCKQNNIPISLLDTTYNIQDITRQQAINMDALYRWGNIVHLNCWPQPNPGFWMEKIWNYFKEVYEGETIK